MVVTAEYRSGDGVNGYKQISGELGIPRKAIDPFPPNTNSTPGIARLSRFPLNQGSWMDFILGGDHVHVLIVY